MRYLEPQLRHISSRLREYAMQPSAYRVCVLYGVPMSLKTTMASKLSEELEGKYIDLLRDKLLGLQPRIGLYRPIDLKKDISLWSKETNSLLVLDEIEPLLDTWPREEQRNLFKLLSRWRTDSVILIVTRLDLPYEDLLGKERVFRIGQLGEGKYAE